MKRPGDTDREVANGTLEPLPTSVRLPLVGRQKETTLLEEAIVGATQRRGGVWVLEGAGGEGKTRLLQWTQDRGREQGFRVRWGRCQPFVSEPLFPWSQVFRAPGREPIPSGTPSVRAARDRGPAGQARVLPSPANRRVPPAAVLRGARGGSPKPGAPLSATLLAWFEELEQSSAREPQLLLLDDFQWADPSSVEALRFFARNIENLPVLIVLARRPHESPLESPTAGASELVEALDALEREGLVGRVPMTGLGEREMQKLVESALRSPLSPFSRRRTLRALAEWTGGNPFFLLEVLRAEVRAGHAGRSRFGVVLALPQSEREGEPWEQARAVEVPPAVQRMLQARLASLDPESRELLDIAALIGQEFDEGTLSRVLGAPAERTRERLVHLREGGWLTEPKARGRGRWRFSHTMLWDEVRQGGGEGHGQDLRKRLATWWEETHPDDTERLAWLWKDVGEPARGLQSIRRAVDPSRGELHLASLPRLLRWQQEMLAATGVPQADRVRQGLDVVRAWYRERMGSPPLLESLDLLRESARGTEIEMEARSLRLRVLAHNVNPAQAERDLALWDTERKGSSAPLPPQAELDISQVRAYLRVNQSRWGEAVEAARNSLRLLEGSSDTAERMDGIKNLVFGLVGGGDPPTAEVGNLLAELDRLSLVSGRARDRYHYLQTIAVLAVNRGDLKAATKAFEETIAVARRAEYPGVEAVHHLNLAIVRVPTGDDTGARSELSLGRQLARRLGIRWLQAAIYMEEAEVEMACKGQFRRARDRIDALLPGLPKEVFATPLWERSHLILAEASLALGDEEGSQRALDEARSSSPTSSLSVRYFRVLGRLRLRQGDPTRAREAFEEAISRAQKEGNRLHEGEAALDLSLLSPATSSADRSKAREEAEAILTACGADLPTLRRSLDATFPSGAEGATGRAGPSVSSAVPTLARPRGDTGLTIRGRLLLHLLGHGAVVRDGTFSGPDAEKCTQAGISQALELAQSAFSKTLIRLEEEGFVQYEVIHVRGASRRVKTYFLTAEGLREARRLRDPGSAPLEVGEPSPSGEFPRGAPEVFPGPGTPPVPEEDRDTEDGRELALHPAWFELRLHPGGAG